MRERQTADERSRREEFLSAIEASPNGVLLLDAQDHIDWMNVTAASHFGIDAERDRAQRVTNLVRAPTFVAYLQSGRFDDTLSMPSPTGNGSLLVAVRPYGDAMKLVLSQDVTERDRNDRMRRDFVANVSHEIRSPLTVLAGFLETMENLPLTDAERSRVLVLMRQQTDRMQSLVSDLLTLAQIEAAPRPLSADWLSMSQLGQRLAADAAALDKGQHDLVVHAGPEMGINGIESELFSALWNLVSNAMRYTPKTGRVELAWGLEPDGTGWFQVSDNGPGIAREHIPRLTERFYRVDHSRSRETGGTGLGLAIVKHVVQRHDGELKITSEPGLGACFRIEFPGHRVRPGSAVMVPTSPPAVNLVRSTAG
ncbi:MAG: phosphate regulon sensor histidine kinase PhoR [Rubrivivax sp. SCN 71-131]|nr:MAG: phosphate regulon sensor histidine kinase PhoR [Rubrivivax sp. SCN 71-131]